MTHDKAKILKLSSGEEIICNVLNSSEEKFISVSSPMQIKAYPKATSRGIEEALTLQRWIHFAEEDVYRVPISQVIVLAEASYGLHKFYEYCVKKSKWEEEQVLTPPTDAELAAIEKEQEIDDYDYEDELEEWEPESKLYH